MTLLTACNSLVVGGYSIRAKGRTHAVLSKGQDQKTKQNKTQQKTPAMIMRFHQQRAHRHVLERLAAFLSVPQQACARRASKALWEAVTAASMEDMLRATVVEHQGAGAVDAQLVVVVMSRVVGPFPSVDALVAWCGGLTLLYEELQLRFPHAAAIGVSARLAAIRPFPFASGSTVMTVCVVTAVASASSTFVVESTVLGVRNATNILRVSALSHTCPILCLEGATPEQFPNIVHSFPTIRTHAGFLSSIEGPALKTCNSIQSVCLANVPLLDNIGKRAFAQCEQLTSADFFGLSSLQSIAAEAFWKCESLESISLEILPHLESIGENAFAKCVQLSIVNLSNLPSLRNVGAYAFWKCESLQSISFANLPLLESIDDKALAECAQLSTVKFSNLPSLRCIGAYAFFKCKSLQSICIASLPVLESIDENAFAGCVKLSSVDFSDVLSLRRIGERAFFQCESLQSICFASFQLLESVGEDAFAGCEQLSLSSSA